MHDLPQSSYLKCTLRYYWKKELHCKSFQLILLETLLLDKNQIVSHLRAQQSYTQSFIMLYKENVLRDQNILKAHPGNEGTEKELKCNENKFLFPIQTYKVLSENSILLKAYTKHTKNNTFL